eukprot:TRINITY_DN105411_c0_g1_i1.p1 TRINITY_DN105411_c0_g1~~TRINITY_DN105411_c0_g1_i1.p1  ORF type:complete len:1117 (-),score=264.86 TRINITY_DN105411_c0_g1_i1:360-3710(-)
MLAEGLNDEGWNQLVLSLPRVLKRIEVFPPVSKKDPSSKENDPPPPPPPPEPDDGEPDEPDPEDDALRQDLCEKLFPEDWPEEEGIGYNELAENCQQNVFGVSTDFIDLQRTFVNIQKNCNARFPASHVRVWETDKVIFREEINIIVQHLKSLIELCRALKPPGQEIVDDDGDDTESEAADSDFNFEDDADAGMDKEAAGEENDAEDEEEEVEEYWYPPVNVDKEDLVDAVASKRMEKAGFPIKDAAELWEELACEDTKSAKSKAKARSGETSKSKSKSRARRVLPLSVLANWAALNGYPIVIKVDAGRKKKRELTIFDKAITVRTNGEWLWNANYGQALIDCMIADEPIPALVESLLRKPKVDVDARDESFGLTGLHFAARMGNTEVGLIIIEKKARVDMGCNMGNTPMHLAAKGGYVEFLKLLLGRKASVKEKNSNGWTSLHWACSFGHLETTQELIKAKAKPGVPDAENRTEAMWAAKHGHAQVLAELLEFGFDINFRDKSGLTVADHAQGHLGLRHSLLEAEKRNQTLLKAAQRGNQAEIHQALEDGAYVDARDEQGWTALVWSMMHGSVDLVATLATHSADPGVLNECSEVLDHLNLQGDAVRKALEGALSGGLGAGDRLLTAARNNDFATAQAELDVGAQVNSQTTDQRHTSLMFAVAHVNIDAAKMLLSRRASCNPVDITGWAAAHYAVQSGNLGMVSILHNHKSDLNVTTYDGTSTMHLAARSGLASMVQLLVAAKCNVNATDSRGRFAVQDAARWGCGESVQALISFKAKVDMKDLKGRNLLCIATAANRHDVMAALLAPLPLPPGIVDPAEEKAMMDKTWNPRDDNNKLLARACQLHARFVKVMKDRARAKQEQSSENHGREAEEADEQEEEEEQAHESVGAVAELAGGPGQMEEADDKGRLAIHIAAKSKRVDTMELLISLRADVDALDAEGNTALILAGSRGDRFMVEVLLQSGASMDVANESGETAMMKSPAVVQDFMHRFAQQRKLGKEIHFPLPPASIRKLWRLRLESLPLLLRRDDLEAELINLFAMLPSTSPVRIIVPGHLIHGYPKGWAYVDYAQKGDAATVYKRSRMEGLFLHRRQLTIINEGLHHVYEKDVPATET